MSKSNPLDILFFWVPIAAIISMTIVFTVGMLIAVLIDKIRGKKMKLREP